MLAKEGSVVTLQQQALEALEKSTKMFEVASVLIKQGNVVEADRIRNEARAQRSVSLWLMSRAKKAEAISKSEHSTDQGSMESSHKQMLGQNPT